MQCRAEKQIYVHEPWIQTEAGDRDMTPCGNQHTLFWIQRDISDSEQSAKEKEIEKSSSKLISSLLSQPMKISKSLHPKLKFILPIALPLTFFFFFLYYIFLQSRPPSIMMTPKCVTSFLMVHLSMDMMAYYTFPIELPWEPRIQCIQQ